MEYTHLLYAIALSAIGGLIQACAGFGYGVFVMSLFPLFMPYTEALVLTSLTSMLSTIIMTIRYRKYIKPRLLIAPTIAFAVTCTISTSFLMSFTDSSMKRGLGVILVIFSMYFLFFNNRVHIKATNFSGAVCGGLSGILSSLFGMGGPPSAVYMLDATDSTFEYMGNLQCFFLSTLIYISAVRFFNGMVTANSLKLFGPCLAGVTFGVFIGLKIFKNMDTKALKYAVYIFMAVMGVRLIVVG